MEGHCEIGVLMTYYELREIIKQIIPRRTRLAKLEKSLGLVKEKGRKKNYSEFKLDEGLITIQRLLNKEEITSFLEVSLRAAHCPMPFNADVYDAVRCPFGCKYCFADTFRASLYTSFFDNSESLGLRHCRPDYFREELDKLMKFRGQRNDGSETQRAIGMEIPIRLGIRFEDFIYAERNRGISLNLLEAIKEYTTRTRLGACARNGCWKGWWPRWRERIPRSWSSPSSSGPTGGITMSRRRPSFCRSFGSRN